MKKRLLALLLVTTLLVCTIPIVASALTMYVYTSNHKSLNLRAEPSKNAQVLTTIPYGTKLTIYSAYNSTWAEVNYKGYSGYAMLRYLVDYKPSSQSHSGGSTTTSSNLFKNFKAADYYVTVRPSTPSGYVNLRWAPSKSGAIHSTYYADSVLHVIAEDGTWCQVYDEANQICGFMMKSFLQTGVGSGASGS